MTTARRRLRICVHGVVQGVGFRPFVYTTAAALGLTGSVRNDSSGAIIEVEGDGDVIDEFLTRLRDDPPPLAVIETVETQRYPRSSAAPGSPSPTRHDRTVAARWPPPTSRCAPTAQPNSAIPSTGGTGTPSSTAPTAVRGSRSSRRCPTTAPAPRWRTSRCAPTAPASTPTRPIAGSTPNRCAAPTAVPRSATAAATAAPPTARTDWRCARRLLARRRHPRGQGHRRLPPRLRRGRRRRGGRTASPQTPRRQTLRRDGGRRGDGPRHRRGGRGVGAGALPAPSVRSC